MSSILVKNASILVTMDDQRREIHGGSFLIRDGFITAIGQELPNVQADDVWNLEGYIVLPGLVNTHHHFYQTLTRAVPAAQNVNLFNWLKALYLIWGRLTPNDIYLSTQIALAELAFSGCTTASDHLYLYPNGSKLDDEIAAAREFGLRLHASRGSMSLGESKGGLPPDSVVENEELILKDSLRLIQQYHDPNPGSTLQVVLAPCSPFSVSGELMRQSALLARQYGVRLHTHLAETQDEEIFCQQKFGYRPVVLMDSLDWLGEDVWFAHSVYINSPEIKTLAKTGSGIAHCPTSNMRLASGIAPILEMLTQGVKVGIGVDGSASNDGSHMLAEARQAMLLSRLGAAVHGASLSGNNEQPFMPEKSLMTARQALEMATRGGAAVLGRTDIGSLEPGKCADFFAVKLDRLEFAGALHDPVAALVFCAPVKADLTVVGGKFIVKEGQLQTVDERSLIDKQNQAAQRLVNG